MELKIDSEIKLYNFRNETHVQFNESVDKLLMKFDYKILECYELYNLYKSALDNEIDALDFIRKSGITPKILEQDKKRDDVFRGFRTTVKGACTHFDAAHREAAEKLLDIFKHYGNIAIKTFDDETAAINDIVREFQQYPYFAAIIQLNLQPWLSALTAENQKFDQLVMERYADLAKKTANRMKTTRVETDKYFRAIVAHIENMTMVKKDFPVLVEFVKEFNEVMKHYRNIMAQEMGRNN